jgi:hypothetical protein
MSLELETLDQLCGGDMPIAVIRGLFNDDEHFVRAITAMLTTGDVQLFENGKEIPNWDQANTLRTAIANDSQCELMISVTKQGAGRVC